jgi:hypothetical protein
VSLSGAAKGLMRSGAELIKPLVAPGRELATAERGLGVAFKDLGFIFERPTALSSPGADVHAIRQSLDEAIAWDKAATRDVRHPNLEEAISAVRQRSADAQLRAEQAQARIRDAQARSEQLAAQEEIVNSKLDWHNDVADSVARQKGEVVERRPLALDAPLINERLTKDSVISFLSDGRVVIDQPGYRQIRTFGDNGSIVEIEPNGNRTTWTYPKLTQWNPVDPVKFDDRGAVSVTEFGNGKLFHRAKEGTVTDMPTGERETLVFDRLKKWEHRDGSAYIERQWWNPNKQVQRWDDKANGERQYL